MNNRLKGFIGLLGAIVLAGGLIIGCSSNPLTALPQDDLQSLNKTLPLATTEAVVSKLVDVELGPDSLLIGREIGTHKFNIPEKGLKAAVTISVKATKEIVLGKNAIVFEFGPDGLVFDKAASIDLDILDLNPLAKSASLYYYDPDANEWLYQGNASVIGGRVKFDIHHFSKYAIE